MTDSKNDVKTIKFTDIDREASLSIAASMDQKKVELPAVYAELTKEESDELTLRYGDRVIPIETMHSKGPDKGLLISFEDHDANLDLVVVCEKGVFRFEHVNLKKYTFATGKVVQLVTCSRLEGSRYNRRRGVRVGIHRWMKLNQDGNEFTVMVRDLSYCGIGLYENGGSKIDITKPFIIELTEAGENNKDQFVTKLAGKVVNQIKDDNGGVVSGCALSKQHEEFLQKYVAQKQLEAIRKRNTFNKRHL
ncbi:MAG: PilZ domain-containing protein [Pseudobutyrivibrio sp.]|nr:PilZ domain-containing protein [Pseudobutyrivibrio sp.]